MKTPNYLRGLREFVEYDVVPIKSATKNWTVGSSPKCLRRIYEFDDHREMCVFVVNSLQHQDHIQHYARMVVEFPTVSVELSTQSLNDITELDKDLAHVMDGIYDESMLGGMDVTGQVQDLY